MTKLPSIKVEAARSKVLAIRLNPEEWGKVKKAAKASKMTASTLGYYVVKHWIDTSLAK